MDPAPSTTALSSRLTRNSATVEKKPGSSNSGFQLPWISNCSPLAPRSPECAVSCRWIRASALQCLAFICFNLTVKICSDTLTDVLICYYISTHKTETIHFSLIVISQSGVHLRSISVNGIWLILAIWVDILMDNLPTSQIGCCGQCLGRLLTQLRQIDLRVVLQRQLSIRSIETPCDFRFKPALNFSSRRILASHCYVLCISCFIKSTGQTS